MSSANHTRTASKSGKKSRIVVLPLPPSLLSRFPSDSKASSSSPIKAEPSPSVQPPEPADKSSDSNDTPVPSNVNDETDANSLAPPKTDAKRKKGGNGGTITGRKRAPPAIDPTVPPRERARPGPKKKPRLPDGTIDRSNDSKKPTLPAPTTAITSHKLGPKANTGAINAGLRALDRSGKPCRKWDRKPLQLKSFTGTMWAMSSWKAPVREYSTGDAEGDTEGSSEVMQQRSSAVLSEGDERSNIDVEMGNGIGMESSPAPPAVAA